MNKDSSYVLEHFFYLPNSFLNDKTIATFSLLLNQCHKNKQVETQNKNMQTQQPMKTSHKIILTLSILLVAGYTWSLDMPLALQVPLREKPYSFSNFQYNFLYFATYGAIFLSDMPLGMVLDKFPIKNTVLIVALTILSAQIGILLSFYFQFSGYKVLVYIMRGICGMMGEALFTIQALLISLYGGKYYDMLIGVGICAPLMFDSFNNVLTPVIYDATESMELVWGIGVFFCVFTLCCGFGISYFATKQQKLQDEQKALLAKEQDKQGEEQEQELSFKGLKTMPKEFWVIVAAVFFTQTVLGSHVDNLNDTIVKRFRISYVNAGYLMFIPYGAAAFTSFFLGLFLQKRPKLRRKIIGSATIAYSLGLLAMYLLPNVSDNEEPTIVHYLVIVLQFATVSYQLSVLYGVLCSSIVYIISKKHLGIGWGVIGSTIGFSQAVSPLIIASILESEDTLALGYEKLTLIVFFSSLFALVFSLWIMCGSFECLDVNSSNECDKKQQQTLKQSLISNEEITEEKKIMQE